MRFSDSLLRQIRDRVSIADYAGKRLSWNKQKTRPSAGDFWACCPFHQEKSASFHVLDAKGIFNCFGCGEKGDLFTLAMKLEGLSFPEAVEKMAEYAGVPLPREETEDRGESDRRKRLYAVVARTAALFANALRSSGGADARKYLQSRGLGPEEWTRFGVGLAPEEWTWAIDKLKTEGFAIEDIIAAGVAREGEDGRRAIDTFRGRITFEITDTTGKPIGFGGRALAKDAKAKYINSPETPLYSKSRVLYRLKHARELLAKTKANGLVVGEGYLDVIAFERAGIAAVAPCGTALTEEQLQLLWRAGGEPVLCFDGDAAGQRAAERALDLALPHLAPGRTVRFAHAPSGEDPDDIFRRAGADALKTLVERATPASDALFEREKQRHGLATPEARAAFQAARARRGKVTSVDKANVLETSRLWREVVSSVHARDYADIKLEHALVDSMAMHLIRQPTRYDVILTENMFGDILSDEASVLGGSIGLAPSASLGGSGPGLFEPVHGSAPDIAGQDVCNPIGAILSVALLLRYGLRLHDEADAVEAAVGAALADGARTLDLGGRLGCSAMTATIIDEMRVGAMPAHHLVQMHWG